MKLEPVGGSIRTTLKQKAIFGTIRKMKDKPMKVIAN